MKQFLPTFFLAAFLAGPMPAGAESFVLNIPPGQGTIAYPLLFGANTLPELIPVAPVGCSILKFNPATASFYTAAVYDEGGWVPADATLLPGEGAFIQSPESFTITVQGTRQVNLGPIPQIYQAGLHFLSLRTLESGTYEDLTGAPPCGPVAISHFDRVIGGFVTSSYDPDAGGWIGPDRILAGESVFLDITTPCTQPVSFKLQAVADKTVSCDADWSFDAPSPVGPCSGSEPTLTVLTTVTNGTCPILITRTWEGVDACNNRATASQTVTVVDLTPPVISGASDLVVLPELGLRTASVTFDPKAADGCGGAVTIESRPASGASFDVGTNRVEVVATDTCGNSSTNYFTVTVQPRKGDLFVADTPYNYDGAPDRGLEPDSNMDNQNMWVSRAIWVHPDYTQPADTYVSHQNPRYGQTNAVWVNVQNLGNDFVDAAELEVYAANASLGLSWPESWTLIGTVSVSAIEPGSSQPVRLAWLPAGTGHYCLLARIVSTNDPMASTEGPNIGRNVRANNNLAWRNVNVANLLLTPGTCTEVRFKPVRTERPPTPGQKPPRQPITVVCKTEPVFHQGAGEATLNLGPWFKRWQDAGGRGKNLAVVGDTTVRMTDTVATIEDIPMDEEEEAIVNLTIKAPQPLPVAGPEHTCHIELVEEMGGKPVGGVNYGVKVRALHTDTDHDGIVDVDDPDDDGDGVADVDDPDPLGEPDCPPSALSIRQVEGKVVLSWNGLGYRLQTTSVLGRAWRPLPHATSPYVLTPEEEHSFFRLICH